MTSVVWFEGYASDLRDEVGGKGASLGELTAAGLPVPPGFVVTTSAFRRVAARSGLAAGIGRHLGGLDVADPGALSDRCAALRELVRGMPLLEDVERDVARAYEQLCRRAGRSDVPVAVRSSANSEDSADASFAGEHDTYLWVRGTADVVDGVRRCWASLFTDRATAYRVEMGYDHLDAAMGVVVQCMVRPRAAGVAFTLNPVDGDRSQIAIDSAWGFGEGVVSGEVTPDHFLVDKVLMQIGSREISTKEHAFVLTDDGRVEKVELDESLGSAASLTDDDVLAVARLARAVERHFGVPQDVEWALGGEIGAAADPDAPQAILLQSRPETYWTRQPASPIAPADGDFMAGIVSTLLLPLHARDAGQGQPDG